MVRVWLTNGLTGDRDSQPAKTALRILVLNLMPNRAVTEQQFRSIFIATGGNVAITFCLPATHHIRHHAQEIHAAYATFPQIRDQFFDGFIITGAPLDQVSFDAVDYWPELQEMMTWRQTHVRQSLFLCWGAYAAGAITGAYVGHQIPDKITGVFTVDGFTMPQSRYFVVPAADVHHGRIVAGSKALGAVITEDPDDAATYVAGHFEYSANTLAQEYFRDLRRHGDRAPRPQHYFLDDGRWLFNWRPDAIRFYRHWLQLLSDQDSAFTDQVSTSPTGISPLTLEQAWIRLQQANGPVIGPADLPLDEAVPATNYVAWNGINVDNLLFVMTAATELVWLVDRPGRPVDIPGAISVLRAVYPNVSIMTTELRQEVANEHH